MGSVTPWKYLKYNGRLLFEDKEGYLSENENNLKELKASLSC